MRRAGAIGALLLAVLIAGLGLSSTRNPVADAALSAAAAARVSVPPGEYTLHEAIRLGLANAADFEPPTRSADLPAVRSRTISGSEGAAGWHLLALAR